MALSPDAEHFYSVALKRILGSMIVLGALCSCAAWFRLGWRVALGFACGSTVAFLNFCWLDRVVSALADRATQTGQKQSSGGVVFRFVFRYFVIAAGAYVILSVSPASLTGFFAGLFLPVAGILCEAGYEAYYALLKSS